MQLNRYSDFILKRKKKIDLKIDLVSKFIFMILSTLQPLSLPIFSLKFRKYLAHSLNKKSNFTYSRKYILTDICLISF